MVIREKRTKNRRPWLRISIVTLILIVPMIAFVYQDVMFRHSVDKIRMGQATVAETERAIAYLRSDLRLPLSASTKAELMEASVEELIRNDDPELLHTIIIEEVIDPWVLEKRVLRSIQQNDPHAATLLNYSYSSFHVPRLGDINVHEVAQAGDPSLIAALLVLYPPDELRGASEAMSIALRRNDLAPDLRKEIQSISLPHEPSTRDMP